MITLLSKTDLGQLEGSVPEGDLVARILDSNWCPATFKDPKGRRHRDNFESINLLVFDIDSSLTITQATDILTQEGFEYLLGTSKSHQIEKNGQPACDRFRIVIPLAEEIMDEDTYKSTWQYYADKYFPDADPQCKDVPRFYYPCKEIVSEGAGIEAEIHSEYLVNSVPPTSTNSSTGEVKRKLYDSTWRFIHEGALPGSFHGAFVSAAQNIRDAGYTFDEALEKLNEAAEKSDGRALEPKYIGQLDDFYKKPINEKYLTAPVEEAPKQSYTTPSELLGDAFSYLNDKEAMQGEPTCFDGLNKLLAGGLKRGELSVLLAEGKTGKSTLFDQLIVHYLNKDIPVGYASREMRPAQEVLPHMFNIVLNRNILLQDIDMDLQDKIATLTKPWQLYFPQGMGAFPKKECERWLRDLRQLGVEYFFIDHFHYCLEDPSNLSELSLFIQFMKQMVNELDIHIFLIVQPTKIPRDESLGPQHLKGGSVIDQTLDNLFVLRRLRGENNKNINEFEIAKKRKLTVKLGRIFLRYDPITTLIEEVKKERIQQEPENQYRNNFPKNWNPRMPKI